jgi:L-lactate dehydrogenase complex protein LldG
VEGGEVVTGRAAVLARLAAAQRTARLPPPPAAKPLVSTPRGVAECRERFAQELAALGVDCHVEGSPEAVCARVSALVEGKKVLSWDPEELPYGLGAVLSRAARGASPRAEQAAAEIGVTGCHGAVAETGSLAVLSGPGHSRSVSLLPPMHVAVVKPEDFCFTMGEFFAREARRIGEAACCTFITGPSRTADIELTLTLGVHGPGNVVVVVGP